VVDGPADWGIEIEGTPHPLEDIRRFAQGASPITFEGSAVVDVPRLYRETQLDSTSVVQVVFVWECSSTKRRQVGARAELSDETDSYTGRFQIEPELIAGSLRLERQLVLAEPAFDRKPLAPSAPGSILWREVRPTSLDLEGVGGVFPTQLVSFSGSLDASAVWAIEVDTEDLSMPAIAAVRLLLNAEHPDVNYLATRDTRDDRARSVLSAIRWDAGRHLVDAAIEAVDRFDLDQEWPDDSVGHNLQLLTRSVFPDMSLEAVESLRRRRPIGYETKLQAGLSLLSGHKFRRYGFLEEKPKEVTAHADSEFQEQPDSVVRDHQVSAAEPEARISYPQLKFIAGLTGGLWLGAKSLRNHPEFPQDELTKQEAHELIDQLQLIPDSQKDRREQLARKWLSDRFGRAST
jgi:hypothetical protein